MPGNKDGEDQQQGDLGDGEGLHHQEPNVKAEEDQQQGDLGDGDDLHQQDPHLKDGEDGGGWSLDGGLLCAAGSRLEVPQRGDISNLT